MKIIHLGVDPRPKIEPPWWDGMTAHCSCGTIVELDFNDGNYYRDVDEEHGIIKSIRISCPICGKTVAIDRPAATTSIRKFEAQKGLKVKVWR